MSQHHNMVMVVPSYNLPVPLKVQPVTSVMRGEMRSENMRSRIMVVSVVGTVVAIVTIGVVISLKNYNCNDYNDDDT